MRVKRILVATDFSEAATNAITQSLAVARQLGADIILAHAGVPAAGETDSKRSHEPGVPDREAPKLSDGRYELGRLHQQLSGQGVTISQAFLDDHHPADAICEAGKTLQADLLVLGSHGRSGRNRLRVGSTVDALTRNCLANVLVVRPPLAPEGFRRILVPIDFEHEPDRPVEGALSVAGEHAELYLLHCWHLPFGLKDETWGASQAKMMTEIRQALAEQFDVRLNELLLRHRRPGIAMYADQVEAGARQGILAQLDSSKYDLVVVGSHRRRGLQRWLPGSVAKTTIRHAHCSVLVVK